jgi:hypothetical protein
MTWCDTCRELLKQNTTKSLECLTLVSAINIHVTRLCGGDWGKAMRSEAILFVQFSAFFLELPAMVYTHSYTV